MTCFGYSLAWSTDAVQVLFDIAFFEDHPEVMGVEMHNLCIYADVT